jgi:hypothetical protein
VAKSTPEEAAAAWSAPDEREATTAGSAAAGGPESACGMEKEKMCISSGMRISGNQRFGEGVWTSGGLRIGGGVRTGDLWGWSAQRVSDNIASARRVAEIRRKFGKVRRLSLLSCRPGRGDACHGGHQRFVVHQETKTLAFQEKTEVPDRRERRLQFAVECGVRLLRWREFF